MKPEHSFPFKLLSLLKWYERNNQINLEVIFLFIYGGGDDKTICNKSKLSTLLPMSENAIL